MTVCLVMLDKQDRLMCKTCFEDGMHPCSEQEVPNQDTVIYEMKKEAAVEAMLRHDRGKALKWQFQKLGLVILAVAILYHWQGGWVELLSWGLGNLYGALLFFFVFGWPLMIWWGRKGHGGPGAWNRWDR